MESPRGLLVDVWREACRHIEITELTETIATMLAEHISVAQLLVRRIDRERCCLETVAMKAALEGQPIPEARTECREPLMQAVLAWCRRGKVSQRPQSGSSPSEWEGIVPSGLSGNVLAGPLGDRESPSGVLIVAAPPGCRFEDHHADLAQMLLEPFSVALDNDHRLREIGALREAAEADKRSLLTKLGRRALGDTVVGADAGLRTVMERVELVARSDVPVLILGETGTGKELVARLIHNRSPRSAGPFIRVNCGAIPSELIDSQLFGHERGAFTGAVETRLGWFERADGGTLLLDELGELPLAAQVRLLRILQDGWLERVGGHSQIKVDVRMVAATHRDLAAMAAEGRFREDLWYRIAVFPIALPPLRDRREDIAALAAHFAARAAVRFGLAEVLPAADDIALLQSYHWPGNIRELATVIDRAAILGNGMRLDVARALGAGVATVRPNAAQDAGNRAPVAPPAVGQATTRGILSLDKAMKQHIQTALQATRGRIEGPEGAAAILQINPHTLRARMRKLGIEWKVFRPGGTAGSSSSADTPAPGE